MRAILPFVIVLGGCSSSPNNVDAGADATTEASPGDDAGSDAASDAGADASDGSVVCTQTLTGDENATVTCTASLCKPTNGTIEVVDTSSGAAIIRPQLTGTFAVGSYTAATLDVTSMFDVQTNGKDYGARAGSSPYQGQSLLLKLDTVVQPSNNPCDGVIHGTFDGTLVELVDGGVGPGKVNVHVVF